MKPETAKKVRLLFVDDEQPFLRMIDQAARMWSKGQWDVHTAQSAGAALSLLQSHAMDLVVIDVQMPVVDGLQFLGLLQRKFPNLQKVVLTGYVNDTYRVACLNSGAELFLEKPRSAEGLDIVFATLNELARYHIEEGFRGVLRQVGLHDVIQMECLSRHSVVLEVTAAKSQGTIYIQDGDIIHATIGDKIGETALNQIVALRGGEFSLKPFIAPPERTIEGSYEFLLMEAVRLRDEATEPAAELAETQASTTTADTASALANELDTAEAPLPRRRPDQAQRKTTRVTGRRRIDELLVCSARGEVLHQWQCSQVDQRVSFLEFISRKARLLASGLPLGKFDRVEMLAGPHRVVVQVGGDRGVLLRSSPFHTPPPARLQLAS